MKFYGYKIGLTIVEMLIVLAIITILASIVITVATRIENRTKEQLTQGTLEVIDTALEQFRNFNYKYHSSTVDYSDFDFPLDCNDFSVGDVQMLLEDALGATSVVISGGLHDPSYSGAEVMYFLLSQVPACRETIGKIDSSLLTNKGTDGQAMYIDISFSGGGVSEQKYPLFRVVDPWGETLRYDFYREESPLPTPAMVNRMKKSKRTFPLITSAGPDKLFGTADDVENR